MIVQSLYQRYLDLSADPSSGVSPLYFSSGKISYVLELEADGSVAAFRDVRDYSGKKPVPLLMNVPEQASRSSGITPYFLTDKAEYAIGYYTLSAKESDTAKKFSDACKKHEAFKSLALQVMTGVEDAAVKALIAFFDRWDVANVRDQPLLQPYMGDLDKGIDTNIAFKLRGQHALVHELDSVRSAWIRYRQQQDSVPEFEAQCLITGETNVPIAKTHSKIKGVRGAQQAGASLVSFNFRSAESYGKDSQQSYNSPVGKTAMFGYTTALNHLLASSGNRMLMGDMTVVFWSGSREDAEEVEAFFAGAVNPNANAAVEDKSLTAQLKDAIKRIRDGKSLTPNMVPHGDTPFYVLGLSPNNARLSVRFFWQGNLADMVEKLGMHAADFSIASGDGRREDQLSSYRILEETRRVGSDGQKVGDEPPARLGGELFRSIILGTAYPHSLYTGVLNRVRADGIVNPLRASIIKAYLVRYCRIHKVDSYKEALTMSLNPDTKEPAYRLGRLFAVLERAQQEAAGGPGRLNATIKDRYFNAAASNPASVFPILIKLSQHHMTKSNFGHFRDKEMQEIFDGVEGFPAHLDLQRQGLFILGYYHQKQYYSAQRQAAAEARNEAAAAGATEIQP
ncbi:type I-C CRISPR-associated protein Cas8c/Csd1 [Cohnella thermotolerans]|uniref:type I-C CRISPR-associated protein Cas8c/Csd1 n=1 Tax=Cohnella thermotolerans TaxID=329858 RepID=UPI0003F57F28|nr:type I-C CRISPR-associated protein Cas8c/Csd1 [Cohnella thermotolerans]